MSDETSLLQPGELLPHIKDWLGREIGVERLKAATKNGSGPPRVAADDPRIPEGARHTFWYDQLDFWRWLLESLPPRGRWTVRAGRLVGVRFPPGMEHALAAGVLAAGIDSAGPDGFKYAEGDTSSPSEPTGDPPT